MQIKLVITFPAVPHVGGVVGISVKRSERRGINRKVGLEMLGFEFFHLGDTVPENDFVWLHISSGVNTSARIELRQQKRLD
jgi:hypothetical protein